ncbi:unnamed protein product, partial [Symbiodinium microadriaticum]
MRQPGCLKWHHVVVVVVVVVLTLDAWAFVNGADLSAVVRVFASKEVNLLRDSFVYWEKVAPCRVRRNVDLILVYSRDFADQDARLAVAAFEQAFAQGRSWTTCFAGIQTFAANLTDQEDQYDRRGYAANKNW